jgi:hypothetical protein
MVGPDPEFPKELNGDNPFLIGDLRVLGNLRLRLLPALTSARLMFDDDPLLSVCSYV